MGLKICKISGLQTGSCCEMCYEKSPFQPPRLSCSCINLNKCTICTKCVKCCKCPANAVVLDVRLIKNMRKERQAAMKYKMHEMKLKNKACQVLNAMRLRQMKRDMKIKRLAIDYELTSRMQEEEKKRRETRVAEISLIRQRKEEIRIDQIMRKEALKAEIKECSLKNKKLPKPKKIKCKCSKSCTCENTCCPKTCEQNTDCAGTCEQQKESTKKGRKKKKIKCKWLKSCTCENTCFPKTCEQNNDCAGTCEQQKEATDCGQNTCEQKNACAKTCEQQKESTVSLKYKPCLKEMTTPCPAAETCKQDNQFADSQNNEPGLAVIKTPLGPVKNYDVTQIESKNVNNSDNKSRKSVEADAVSMSGSVKKITINRGHVEVKEEVRDS